MRKITHTIIYIPGLGDQRPLGQDKAIHAWRIFGVHGVYHPMYWRDKELFEPKFKRLLREIDDYVAQGHTVSLVAASAGASTAVNAFAARKDGINGVVLLCGKINNPGNMNPSTFRNNLAFEGSMAGLPDSLASLGKDDRDRIISFHPLADMTVPIADTIIKGAHERRMYVVGHPLGIAYGLIISAFSITRFLKRLAAH